MRSACFTSKRRVSPDAEVNTGTRAGNVESSKSSLSCRTERGQKKNDLQKLVLLKKNAA